MALRVRSFHSIVTILDFHKEFVDFMLNESSLPDINFNLNVAFGTYSTGLENVAYHHEYKRKKYARRSLNDALNLCTAAI